MTQGFVDGRQSALVVAAGVVEVHQPREEIVVFRRIGEPLAQRCHIERVVLQLTACLSNELQGRLPPGCVLQCQLTVAECEHGVVLPVAAVGRPVGHLGHAGVERVETMVGKQGLTGAIHISLAVGVGRLVVALTYKIGTGVIEVGAVLQQLLGILLAILQADLPLVVGPRVERVEGFGNGEEAPRQVVELRRVLFLLHVKFLVDGLILHQHRLIPQGVNTLVGPVHSVLQQVRHQLLSLLNPLAALQYRPRLTELFALSRRRGKSHCGKNKKTDSDILHNILLSIQPQNYNIFTNNICTCRLFSIFLIVIKRMKIFAISK